MAATPGTPVSANTVAATSFTLTMSGVTSGQPIVLVVLNTTTADAPSASDTFSTPYAWQLVSHAVASSISAAILIGTGGVGTSGVITITIGATANIGGVAIPFTGASTASGLMALDGFGTTTGTSAAPVGPSLAPSIAGECAIYGLWAAGPASVSPSSPWVNTIVTEGGSHDGNASTYSGPPSGTPLAPAWTLGSSHAWSVAGIILRPTGSPAASPNGGIITMLL